MSWIKRNNKINSISEVIENNIGMSISEFLTPTTTPIFNLQEAINLVKISISKNKKIYIFGDYDADGITSTTILYALLKKHNADVVYRLPRRFSEGYGMTEKAVSEFEANSLIITVDNGIMAHDAIDAAKAKGCEVIIIDHHMPGETLPCADVIINPHCFKCNEADFEEFCGAGLALRFAIDFIDNNNEKNSVFIDSIYELAAIGTIADVMPLIKDNRVIVTKGLESLKNGPKSRGLRSLVNELGLSFIDEGVIGFKIAPTINAAGRMHDDGATKVVNLLTGTSNNKKLSEIDIMNLAIELSNINELRKSETKDAVERAKEYISNNCLFGDCPFIIYDNQTSEGLVGIVAGKIAEEYKTPCIVLTDSEDKSYMKGSCRSYGDIDIKAEFDKCSELFIKYGGHAGAAGLSVAYDDFDKLRDTLLSQMSGYESKGGTNDIFYDLEIDLASVSLNEVISELKKYAPYGNGNPEIVFKIKGFNLSPRNGVFYKPMGESGQHLKLFGNKCSAIGFDMTEKYIERACAKELDLIGTISENVFMNISESQISFCDFEAHKSQKITKLASLLELKLKNI